MARFADHDTDRDAPPARRRDGSDELLAWGGLAALVVAGLLVGGVVVVRQARRAAAVDLEVLAAVHAEQDARAADERAAAAERPAAAGPDAEAVEFGPRIDLGAIPLANAVALTGRFVRATVASVSRRLQPRGCWSSSGCPPTW